MEQDTDSIQAQGGRARAQSLSAERRAEIAAKGAAARWNLPKATHEGDLPIGGAIIHCAVLEDKRRVLTQSDVMRVIGRARQAKGRAYYDGDANLPAFLNAKNLKQFIPNDLYVTSSQVEFKPLKGTRAFGYPAELLPKVCEVFLRARDAGVLKHTQLHIAKQADILMRGLAHVGIVALVDEATGYQKERAQQALAEILEKFIAKELRGWTKTFPVEFYEHIFRLHGWKFDPENVKRPSVIGHYTNDIVYARLAPGVLQELREKNPVVNGHRKNKHFQWLTGDIGDPKLRAHVHGVIPLMRISDTWDEFKKYLNKAYPKYEKTPLGFEVEVIDI
jgi:hypothetical protein